MSTKNQASPLQWGKKLDPEEAKAYTDGICRKMYARWHEKILQGPFMLLKVCLFVNLKIRELAIFEAVLPKQGLSPLS